MGVRQFLADVRQELPPASTVGGRVIGQASGQYQVGRRGAGNRGADRPAGTQQQAGGQTGEGSVTGKISIGETFLESQESSVSIERRSGRD